MESIFTLIFIVIFLFFALWFKRVLYIDEYNLSIQNELNTFDENFKKIEHTEDVADFKLGSGHLYE